MQTEDFQAMQTSSYLSGGNAEYIEELYESYLKDPNSVDPHWRDYFQSLPRVNGFETTDISHADIRDYFLQLAKQPKGLAIPVSTNAVMAHKQAGVDRLIDAYRTLGHLVAKLDPLGSSRPEVSELELNHYDLSRADEDTMFSAPALMGKPTATLREILSHLRQVYCNTIGVEYTYILNQREKRWLQEKVEQTLPKMQFAPQEKLQILRELTAADGLEKYLHTKYVGQKRFSLEGGDALIPLLQRVVNQDRSVGVEEIVFGMAHRGRLNVLVNIIGQSPEELFQEFEGRKSYGMTSGDVKYHLGHAADVQTPSGPVHLSLAFNPSHLEIISPVVMGSVRARQDRHQDTKRDEVTSIIIHGDAAFIGQGVVMETFNMSQTRAYGVGGTVHIVVNNQVGFTTSDPQSARSSLYCTDIAKMIDAPVLHVNGDDAEAVVKVAQLAAEYRYQFHKDIVIDLVCFRKHGHNEADEPSATQPLMYQKIRQHPATREVYAQKLIAEKVCSQQDADQMFQDYQAKLDKGQCVVDVIPPTNGQHSNWSRFIGQEWNTLVDTSITAKQFQTLAKQLEKMPPGFEMQRQVGQMMANRTKMFEGEMPFDWGAAETLAYASLLVEGYPIRISGQDSQRGTFAHRHAVLHSQTDDQLYTPLQHLSKDQAKFAVYDSVLSEAAVLGFEYGYSTAAPNTLVIWEAQFGDFANGAQVVIDQFMSSGEQKWKRLAGLAMYLPHGYEGQGPEHSSARLERYLQLCAEDNMQVCVPSTPAQTFHMIRRQMIRPYRKPLIVMTPKSLLRHKLAVSSLDEILNGKFQLVIGEVDPIKPAQVRKVILCSGKVYYDLLIKRRENKQQDVAILRIEQLYPFPIEELKAELQRYKNAKQVVWCQEEPKNQGAWYSTQHNIIECLMPGQSLTYAGRAASAAPAAGYPALHAKQQAQLVEDALK